MINFAVEMSNILITGATGFIGGFIVDEALRRNMNVWVALRKSSSRQWLTDERIHFLEVNLTSEEDLVEKMRNLQFDYVVHAAGVTKCLHKEDFHRINVGGTKSLVNALLQLEMPLKKFVYLSSLSVFGPIREEQPYTEITENDKPAPNTEYGKSKLEAEHFLMESELPIVILRPTGVYGPRERDYFMMAKSIKAHTDFAVGYKPQDITFVYVLDVVQAIFLAIEKGEPGRKFFLSDGGDPWWIRITAPIWLLRIITFCGEYIGRMTGKITALNNDKYHIMKQRNWRCDIEPARRELGFEPHYQLEEGVRLTIQWYRENGWL